MPPPPGRVLSLVGAKLFLSLAVDFLAAPSARRDVESTSVLLTVCAGDALVLDFFLLADLLPFFRCESLVIRFTGRIPLFRVTTLSVISPMSTISRRWSVFLPFFVPRSCVFLLGSFFPRLGP